MLSEQRIIALRMERQCLTSPADEAQYAELYRDLQPGQSVYWNGFGQPPVLSFRAAFDDIAFNRARQLDRRLIKGRFAGGNLGWIVPEDIELFAALYRKPLTRPTQDQQRILELILQAGPMNIQQIKAETGLLVKQITPALHRLQEAFLIYEDQYDGEWDRGWYRFGELFPDVDPDRCTRAQALTAVLRRFAYRMVWFDAAMAKGVYRLPEKELRAAMDALTSDGVLVACRGGWMLAADAALLQTYEPPAPRFVYALHRNDILCKAHEQSLKARFRPLTDCLPYDHDHLQYLLIDGEFRGVAAGHFRNGPYDLNDIIVCDPGVISRREEIIAAVRRVNFDRLPQRFMGTTIKEGE